jgi:hypothetical protein
MLVAVEEAAVEPPAFVAVTTTAIVRPMSLEATVYALDVAPAMFEHEPPAGSQSCHRYA